MNSNYMMQYPINNGQPPHGLPIPQGINQNINNSQETQGIGRINDGMMYNDSNMIYNNKIPMQPNMIIDQNNTYQTQNK